MDTIVKKYSAIERIDKKKTSIPLMRLLFIGLILLIIIFFMPWTQNIHSPGKVTTINPDSRPQTIHSTIDGRIEKWYVKEGDFVQKGDTILFISEIKNDYLDPNLVENTKDQLSAKELSVDSYMDKARALDNQIDALIETRILKLKQTENKIKQAKLKIIADSMDYQTSKAQFDIAKEQYNRMEELYKKGLKSLTEMENRRMTMQKSQAEMISYENKLLTSRNELINAEVEYNSVNAQYRDDIAKAEAEKFATYSNMYEAETNVLKLQNQYTNYSLRNNMYFITAPQDGYITKAIQYGIGKTIKEGEEIVSLMPANYELAIESYVRPIDLPLLEKGQKVRVQFDGWPAIVFSGWPNVSYGTYGGIIYAIDNFANEKGEYRIMIQPDKSDHSWPEQLRVGSGAHTMILLKDVPVWYEVWRQINGFPPEYYSYKTEIKNNSEK